MATILRATEPYKGPNSLGRQVLARAAVVAQQHSGGEVCLINKVRDGDGNLAVEGIRAIKFYNVRGCLRAAMGEKEKGEVLYTLDLADTANSIYNAYKALGLEMPPVLPAPRFGKAGAIAARVKEKLRPNLFARGLGSRLSRYRPSQSSLKS